MGRGRGGGVVGAVWGVGVSWIWGDAGLIDKKTENCTQLEDAQGAHPRPLPELMANDSHSDEAAYTEAPSSVRIMSTNSDS